MNLLMTPPMTTAIVDFGSLELAFQDACSQPNSPEQATVSQWLAVALQASGVEFAGELTLRLVDESESAELNSRFRSRAGATNVLSFPGLARAPGLPSEVPQALGDIVICAPLVPPEAAERGVSEVAHWAHLVVHGMLHLLGYDHLQEDEQQRMEQLEITALAAIGFADPYNPEGSA